MPGLKIWLDVDELTEMDELEESVKASAVFVIYYSRNYFWSKNCQRELYTADSIREAHHCPIRVMSRILNVWCKVVFLIAMEMDLRDQHSFCIGFSVMLMNLVLIMPMDLSYGLM